MLARYFDISCVQTKLLNNQLIFIIQLPVTESILKQLYNLIPLPFPVSEIYFAYFPLNDFPHPKYIMLDSSDTCKTVTDSIHLRVIHVNYGFSWTSTSM